jgi:hypothetical protein
VRIYGRCYGNDGPLDGRAVYTTDDEHLQACFDAVAIQSRSYGNARIGRDFIRKYRKLLPSEAIGDRSALTTVSAVADLRSSARTATL